MAHHRTPSHHFLACLALLLALGLQVRCQQPSTCPLEIETITTSIPENVPDGSLVYDLQQRFPQHFDTLFVIFINPDAEAVFESYFSRDTSTNRITTSGDDFDRDQMAVELGNHVAPVVFNISVSSYELTPTLEIVECVYLIINVIDVDDQVPEFRTSSSTIISSLMIEFREDDEEIRRFKTLPLAIDTDEGENGTRMYVLEDSIDQTFVLEILKDEDTQEIEDVLLRNLKPLDREERDMYHLTVIASEGKDDGDHAVLQIMVNITDTCDERPDFGTSSFVPLVAEDTGTGHTIMQFDADDPDLGVYGELEYHIKSVCTQKVVGDTCIPSAEAEELFDLDMETGNLVLQQELDREEQAQYDIVVEAVDGCGKRTTATASIQVQDINDNEPTVVYSGLQRVLENNPSAFLGLIDVADPDLGANGTVVVELFDNSTGHLIVPENFRIFASQDTSPNRYRFELIKELNRELVDGYSLVIVARDQGMPALSSTYPLLINILDENDNRPIFEPFQDMILVKENETINTQVLHLRANDLDVDADNSHVTYELPPSSEGYPHQGLFRIEATTGRLLIAQSLDREQHATLPILVLARDNPLQGDSPLNSTVVVNIVLEDVNDNPPVIHSPTQTLTILESQQPPYILATVNATDSDSTEQHSTLSYDLTGSSSFSIDPQGNINLVSAVDFDSSQQNHEVTIIVSDGVRTIDQSIVIAVQNVNDEKPTFISSVYEMTVIEEEPSGASVVQVVATDNDPPPHNFEYSFNHGNEQGHFQIDPSTGWITTTVPLNREATADYTLFVAVSDGELSSDGFARVLVCVGDSNDHPPELIGSTVFRVPERVPSRQIGTLEVDDPDTGDNARVLFRIIGGNVNDSFAIGNESGILSVTKSLDREAIALNPNTMQSEIILTIEIKDRGSPPHVVMSNLITVVVEDVNDNGPVFQEQSVTFRVPENEIIGNVIGRVQATDVDLPPNNETDYSISGSTEVMNVFNIAPDTGELRLNRMLDFETTTDYQFTVFARDPDQGDLFDTIMVSVIVEDTFDPVIEFVQFNSFINLVENNEQDCDIITLEVIDTDTNNPVPRLQFSLANEDPSQPVLFGIEKEPELSIATIYTLTSIDREALGRPEIRLNVTAHDTNPPSPDESYGMISATLTITILDENDERPTFEAESYQFDIDENLGVNEPLNGAIVTATDPDAGENGTVSYSVRPASLPFEFNTAGELVATEPLDREDIPTYMFTVVASDGGSPPFTTEVEVTVAVNDINDNSPVFHPSQAYHFNISENMPAPGVIAVLDITDADEGSNARIELAASPETPVDNHFFINPSGSIELVSSLDRETLSFYRFEVEARDYGVPRRTTRATINITVLDFNDHCPEFVNSVPSVDLLEDFSTTEIITTISARDNDGGSNANILYAIGNVSLSETFCIGADSGRFQLCEQNFQNFEEGMWPPEVLDYERETEYDVEIIAFDQGSPRCVRSKILTVRVGNVNEHTPRFDRSMPLEVFVDEGQEAGTVVARIRAYDLDNDELSYSITEQLPQAHFRWDAERGAIVTTRELDYEDGFRNYMLTLSVTEVGVIPATTVSIAVEVFVHNINDHSPAFDSSTSSVVISENEGVDTTVITVTATDRDNVTSSAVLYSIVSGNDGGTFSIDSKSGRIFVASNLDYDTQASYVLAVTATDTGPEPRTSEPLLVTITLINENDELPIFSETEYAFPLSENSQAGVIGVLNATDRDVGSFGTVRYAVTAGASEYITVNEMTGVVSSVAPIDREALSSNTITFMVTASDLGQPSQTAVVPVTVTIVDVNDNTPLFSRSEYLVPLSNDLAVDTTFERVEVRDLDEGSNAEFSLEIVSIPTEISVEVTSSGDLVLKQPLPQDYQPVYELTLRAVDSQDSSRASEAVVKLIVESETDHHPWFDQQTYDLEVSENLGLGDTVFDFTQHVTDQDAGSLTYAFEPQSGQFLLDLENGRIVLGETLDFESTESYELSLFATDETSRTAAATLVIHITDYNDGRPLFINPPSTITLSIVDTRDIELFTVRAEDSDTGVEDNSRVGYSIVDSTEDTFFAIDDVTGVVTNTAPLVGEMTYSFVIRAFDYGTPLMSSNITVIVTVQDPATEAPKVSVGSIPFHLSLSEALSYPAVVYSSFQPESETPVADSYHIVYQNSSEGLFTVDESDGVLRLQSSLDFERETQYRLVVEARRVNPATGARYSTYVKVDITVEDENDNRPVFEPIGMQTVSESKQPRAQLFTVTADDLDSGSLGEVQYTIIGGNVGQVFSIDSESGDVTLEQTLERELLSSYQLEIRASDMDLNPQTAEITVPIEVLDVNDNVPAFESNFSIGVYESPVTMPGDRVMQVVATDEDILPSLFYKLTLVKATFRRASRPISEHLHAFEIDFDTGEVRVGPGYELNREEIDCFQLAINASDTVNTVTTYLTITVLDVNEFAPVVTAPSALRILELLPEGSLVTNQIHATDEDTGINAAVLYRLGDEWPEGFMIDELSGAIRIRNPIAVDPASQEFTGTVLAVDQGVPPLTGTATISVELRDVNNHPPLFDQPSYEIPVSINQPRHQVFFTFNVTDNGDIGFNTAWTIKLPVYYEAFTYFSIDPEGTMSLKRDRTTGLEVGDYVFRVQAVNSSPFPYAPYFVLGTSVDVVVRVHPENIAAPVFSQEVYTTMIAESLPPTTRLGLNVSATDADMDGIRYSIRSNVSLPFEIDAASGVIRLMSDAQLNSEQTSFYRFTIQATDTGFPTLTTAALVEVTIIDVNEHPPEFSRNGYGGTVAENSAIDTLVLTISATDPDHSDRPVSFELIPPEGEENFPFRITQFGMILTTAMIDAESLENPSYIFSVVASDGERPPLETTTTVTINVTGVNEFEPEFVTKTYNFTVDSNLRMNAVVGRVQATDLDRGSGGALRYRFTDDARNDEPKQYFRIVETTGEIVLTVDPLTLAEQRRKRAVTGEFRTFQAIAEVTDGEIADTADVTLNLHTVFITEPGATSPSSAVPFEIIAAVVAAVVIAIFVFVAILLTALYIRMRRRSKMKIRDLHKNDVELERYSRNSGSTTPSQSQNRQTAVFHQQSTITAATLSGSDADDEESIIGEGAAIGYPSQSPGLPHKAPVRPSPRARSTSSLVNDSSQETAPYSKAQIEAIYAANQELLNDDGSQESIHSFCTEGGQEADGDVDIDNILLSRKFELEDDEDSTTIMEDDASYMKDIHSNGSDSTGGLDIPPVEVRDEPYQFSQERDWNPHSHATTIADTIDELATNASYDHSQRRPIFRGEFEPSQPTSLYGASTQGSRVSLLRMQQKHFDSDHQLRGQVPADYYYADSPRDNRSHPRHLPRSHRYGSETALMDPRQHPEYVPPDRLSSRHMYSQDLHPYHRNHGHYISGRPLTPPSSTPTDGTVTPQRALNPDYDMQHYLSSSSTSLASTNLSQPIGPGRISSINPSYR